MVKFLFAFATRNSLIWGFLLVLGGCNELMTEVERGGPSPDPNLPTVTTTLVKKIAGDSALGDGNVINASASPVTARGVCWNTSGNPTIADSFAANGRGVGVFQDTPISRIKPNTVYYVRAYATNEQGTAYGNEISFDSGFLFGTFRQGGLVFLNDGYGGGLVVEASDSELSRSWSNVVDLEIGGTSEEMNSGMTNTELIISQSGHTSSPAQECDNLVSSGYDDWYLPSLGTVRAFYLWLHREGLGNFKYQIYWSSTEVDNLNALAMIFDNRGATAIPKKDSHRWRCVRFSEQL